MPKRMLIDASHPEETRVIVLDGQKVEEFDFEAASKRPLKGNIYLAKVTRVEPSLQAAFVEYGGNRQGFLAFSEIHPDYYQIPVADRMALLAEQEAEARRRNEDEFESVETGSAPAPASTLAEAVQSEHADFGAPSGLGGDSEIGDHANGSDNERELSAGTQFDEDVDRGTAAEEPSAYDSDAPLPHEGMENAEINDDEADEAKSPRTTEGLPAAQAKPLQSAKPAQRWMRRRHYKIQEVIKRRQIILVQVVKEERGTKGAALTTYLSLAGRYCVLMPNTPRGGGISRKITSAADRNRLKAAAQSLELPEGMGLIIRTAGENRTKTEIKRDYEYLLRMWDTVRELTLRSNAPACVYEEGDLIKRAIRDLYNKDVAEIVVEGDDGYRNAKEFMRMLMPSHAKNVKPYKEAVPLFQRFHVEAQLDAMFSATVTLRSGGYIVINQTEALVAIDVNSGRATREHSIEETAHKTNLEAAEEIARQLRLRDLAGLIVIDFIDMEDSRNDRNVEKRLRDCVKNDRARVQIGKISQFGLLEMSRQRLRAGVVAGSTVTCPNCGGQGIVRSVESTALRLLRAIEEEGQRQRAAGIIVRSQSGVAIYTLNQKRRELARMETEYGLTIQFELKDDIVAGTFELDRVGQKAPEERLKSPLPPPPAPEPASFPEEETEAEEETAANGTDSSEQTVGTESGAPRQTEGRRRRRRRRRGREHAADPMRDQASVPSSSSSDYQQPAMQPPRGNSETALDPMHQAAPATGSEAPQAAASQAADGSSRRKRRRRRRGRRPREDANATSAASPAQDEALAGPEEEFEDHDAGEPAPTGTVQPLRDEGIMPNAPSEPQWSLSHDVPAEIGAASLTETESSHAAMQRTQTADKPAQTSQTAAAENRPSPSQPARKGWWQRPFRARD